MLSTCLRCGKRKNMQLFMNHVEVEFMCNGCKNITNCIMHTYAFSTWAYFNRCIPNGSMGWEYKCNEESMLLKDGANQAKICKAWIRLLTIGGTSIKTCQVVNHIPKLKPKQEMVWISCTLDFPFKRIFKLGVLE